jgi:hypothetical protein
MALMERATAIAPYAQQLLYNSDVQASARQAAQATRAAYRRARGKEAEEIIRDKKFRRRTSEAAAAISGLWKEVEESTPKQKSRWRWPAIALGLAVGGAVLITIGPGRAWLSELLGGNEPDLETPLADPAALSTDPGTTSARSEL